MKHGQLTLDQWREALGNWSLGQPDKPLGFAERIEWELFEARQVLTHILREREKLEALVRQVWKENKADDREAREDDWHVTVGDLLQVQCGPGTTFNSVLTQVIRDFDRTWSGKQSECRQTISDSKVALATLWLREDRIETQPYCQAGGY